MSSSQDWIFSKAYIEELNATEEINGVMGRRKEFISKTIWLMEDITKSLNLDRKVMTTAAVYFHRFFIFHTFNDQKRLPVAVACLFLASKVEEKPIKLRDIVQGFYTVYKKTPELDFPKQVLLAERILLNTLGFELNVAHPLMVCGAKLKDLRAYATDETNKLIYQAAVNFINDSYRSTLCLQYSSAELGLALLFLATVQVGIKPTTPRGAAAEATWLDLLSREVDEDIIRSICLQLLDFYESEAFITTSLQPKKEMDGLRRQAFDQLGLPLIAAESDAQQLRPLGSPSPSHTDADLEDYDRRYPAAEEAPRVSITKMHSQSGSALETPQPDFTDYGTAEDTPYAPPPPADTPSSTPGFADIPAAKRRERTFSTGEESVGDDFKRQRNY